MEMTEAMAEMDVQVRSRLMSLQAYIQANPRLSGPSQGGNSDTKYYDPARNAHLVR